MRLLDEIRDIPMTAKALRSFGYTMAGAFTLLAAFLAWKGHGKGGILEVLLAAAVLFGVCGRFRPSLLGPLNRAWMTLALLMGWVMTRVILSFVFFAVLTPLSLALRLFGKDFLAMKKPKNASTYWTPRAITESDKTRFERQF